MHGSSLEQRVQQLEDKAAIKAVVDSFSTLADSKDVKSQLRLFTEDATVQTYFGDELFGTFKGKGEIDQGFSGYLANFDTVYHINGQQTVELHGDHATGTSYCLVVLIRTEGKKQVRSDGGVFYSDDYVRQGSNWFIEKRVAHFAWRDSNELTVPTV